MNARYNFIGQVHRFGFLAVVFLSAASAWANPVSMPGKNVRPEIAVLICLSILLEVLCVWLALWRVRKPRLFILWLIGVHALTFPGFIGLLWFLQTLRPAYAVATGESVVVVAEGLLIFAICRSAGPKKPTLDEPTMARCLFASFVGNLCSAMAFPVLTTIYERFLS